MIKSLKEIVEYRELLWSMVRRDLKIRYKNSVLGFFWSFISPALTTLVFWFVFKHILRIHAENYSAYLLSAMLPYAFIQQCVLDSSQSVIASIPILKKVYFPRELLPLSHALSNLIHFALAIVVFLIYLLFVFVTHPGDTPFRTSLFLLPLLFLVSFCLAMGLGFIVSALNVFYEDIKYMTQIALYLLMYLCPILYFSEQVKYSDAFGHSDLLYTLYHLNPVAMLIVAYRKVLLPLTPVKIEQTTYPGLPLDWTMFGITIAMSLFILVFGFWTFTRLKERFVERI